MTATTNAEIDESLFFLEQLARDHHNDGAPETALYINRAATMLHALRDQREAEWRSMDSAPKDQCVMLSYQGKVVRFGQYNSDQYAKTPVPYWTNDVEYLYGKRATRANQPNAWKPVPAAMSAQGEG